MSGFPTLFQEYIYKSRYARYLHDENRREVWSETVKRYFEFFTLHLKTRHEFEISKELRRELENAILNLDTMPSMRCLMTAGPALEKSEVAGYNCSYVIIDHPKAFAELLYILMCGTGVGFSVERQYVNKLPEVPDNLYPSDTTIIVNDSKLGWAKALNELISLLYIGNIPKWDLSKLRPAGAVLKTFGGRSSGPGPLDKLFKFVVQIFQNNKGNRLTSLDCHDISCMVGSCVVVGGVRRSALISLSNLSDDRMRNAKTGQWWTLTPYRSISNNSAVYTDKIPAMDTFISEWKSLYDSKSGERGIFSRYAAKNVVDRSNAFRKLHYGDVKTIRYRETEAVEFGCNPCSEILLRPNQFCNLTEVVVRATDTLETLKQKCRIAAILGTFQATLTDFKFLSKKWKDNTEDERLLGVSLTGIMDHEVLSGSFGEEKLKKWLTEMRKTVISTNLELSKKIGIPASVASTCVKPSGTVSSLVDTASGIHRRHAPYYLRTVRADKKDPLAHLMINQGFYHEDDVSNSDHNYVFYFPIKAPKSSLVRADDTAVKQLEVWMLYQKYWTDHKPSVTISVKEHEWMQVGAWCYDHFEWLSGVSFLPYSDHAYQQAPFQEINEEQYREWVRKMPQTSDWNKLVEFEKKDETTGAQELACTAGCEL
ncbi:MAG TPA: ribonucleoside-triphosphate reductase [Methylomirabilota bacterium]|nr:ribonucleoside-triphosphate reductase [Methylomirabilota bacterium]